MYHVHMVRLTCVFTIVMSDCSVQSHFGGIWCTGLGKWLIVGENRLILVIGTYRHHTSDTYGLHLTFYMF